eukprot:3249766-Pleurochrysis_carterae.AAC.5
MDPGNCEFVRTVWISILTTQLLTETITSSTVVNFDDDDACNYTTCAAAAPYHAKREAVVSSVR